MEIDKSKEYIVAIHNDDIITRTLFGLLSEKTGIQFTYKEYPNFIAAYNGTVKGEADFIGNLIKNDKRALDLDFSSPTNIQNMYLYTKERPSRKSIQTIATPKGAIAHKELVENKLKLNVKLYSSIHYAIKILNEQKVNGVIGSTNYLKLMLSKGFYATNINRLHALRPMSLAATKGKHKALLDKLASAATSEYVQQRLNKEVSSYVNNLKMDALKQRIKNNKHLLDKTIKIRILDSYPNLKTSPDGTKSGIAYEVVFEACGIIGAKCELVNKEKNSWSDIYSDLLNGHVDIIAPMAKVDDLDKERIVSNKFHSSKTVLVKRKNYKDGVYFNLQDMFVERIGVVKGSIFVNKAEKHLPRDSINTYVSGDELLEALLNKDIDYVISPESHYNYYQILADGELPIVLEDAVDLNFDLNFGLGFQKNKIGKNYEKLFSDAISLIKTEDIVSRHEKIMDWRSVSDFNSTLTTIVFNVIIFVSILLLSTFFYWKNKSMKDALTSLNNRFSLRVKCSNGIKKGHTLIYFDVNKFKVINDNYGHKVGDEVLKRIGANISKYWPGYGYRIGGDEFVLIGKFSPYVVDDMMNKIGNFSFELRNGTIIKNSISYGIYVSNGERETLEEMLHLADCEMYKHKG